MSNPDVQDLLRMRNNPDYLNWMAVGEALLLLSNSLRKYAEKKMKEFHALITTNVGGPGVKCHCRYTLGKKPNPHGRPTTTCIWAQELKGFHVFSRKGDIPWHQSISSQWDDPVHGYWEIAKLFMSDLGKNLATTKDPSTTDGGPLLNLLMFCNHFKVQKAALAAIKDWRNKWAHAPDHTLSDKEKNDAFTDIDCLMTDPELVGIKEVQDCHQAIEKIQTADILILQSDELKIIQECRLIWEYLQDQELNEKIVESTEKIEETKEEIEEAKEKIEETKEEIEEAKEKIEEAIEEIRVLRKQDKLVNVMDKMGYFFLTILLFTVSPLLRNVPGMLWSLMAIFMFSQVGDRSVISDYGCPTAVMKSQISQYQFQEFYFSSYLAYKREGFVGRKWFFLELESIFEKSEETAGVLITGAPGSGKSALMSQLICSPYSSLLIHDNTIGYHLCEYSEKGKRDGARFVRNLVDQIAARLPEYSKYVMNNEEIRTELDTDCHKDPTSCFFSTIVGPLRTLKKPDGPRFIIIDALDECFESDLQTSEIMEILNSKIPHFPKWLKVILTSRNLTSVTSRLPQMRINRTPFYAADKRNVNDIRYYVSRFISQNTDFSERLLMAMNIGSKTDSMKIFLDKVITRAEGNFLFVKMTLQYMNDTGGEVDFYSLPTNLFDLYDSFFNRQFGEDGFGPYRSIFEVLLAVYSPLQSQDVQEILKSKNEVGDISTLIDHVSCFLRFGRDGTVTIYHQSFAEWLINQTAVLSINKTRGHQSIAKFLLRRISERHMDVTFGELTELFMHILSARALELQETVTDVFNITEIREPQTNQSILHYLVTKPNIYLPVLDFFLHKFQMVDVLDASNKTPAFYAASEGFVRSLQSCINNGADISSLLKGYTEIDPVSVLVRNTGIEEFSLMHIAAAKGHADVVELLIKSNLSFPESSKSFPTPLHLAAGNGHLEVVKLFYYHNATFDSIILHHAAARNHSAVVEFLLQTVGLCDTCIPCQPEHFSQLSLKTTRQEAHAYFCETALHAAVSRGLGDIVQILLSLGKESLECKHHSGKTVLMDAVERNDTEMVDLLLRHGANVTTECGRKISKYNNRLMCSIYSVDKQKFLYTLYCVNDSCECGNRAIHVSAKYGLWEMAEKITSERILDMIDLLNCGEDSALYIAIAYDHARFVQNINNTFNKVGQYLVASKMVQRAVTRCSANVAKLFLNYPVNYKDENVWDLLLDSVKWSPCDELKAKGVSSHCLEAFTDRNLSDAEKTKKESERRLNIIKLLIETHQQESLVSYKKDDGVTLLHCAAFYGFEDAVKYLVELGADKLLKDQNNGYTPLMFALYKSPVNKLHPSASYRCYTTKDGQFTSCNTTCHDETVRYLIQSQRRNIAKCDHESSLMLKRVIVRRMPLSLYTLLKIGVDLNCRFNYFGSVMLLHLHSGGREVSEVLNMFEVDISIKCEVSFSMSEPHQMSFFSTPDKFGNFFKPSLNKKRFPLQRLIDRHPRGARILDECYDAEGYLPIHRAAQGGNLAAIKWFITIGVNTQLKTRSGLTALGISILELRNNTYIMYLSNSETFVKINSRYRNECFEELLRTFFETSYKNYTSDFSSVQFYKYPILHSASKTGLDLLTDVYNKALEIIPSLKRNKFLLLDEQDENGDTPLHIAALSGLEDVVKYLVRLGADIHVKNKDGNIPLLTALRVSSVNVLNQLCYTTNDRVFISCKTTPHDEIVRYLLWLHKSSISNCDAQTAFMLKQVIVKRMPLSLYALLEIGVDVNCQVNESLSPFLRHIRVGSEEVSEVLKIFEVDISVECGVPFSISELHLISYVSTPGDFGSFFQPSLNKKRFPLQRLIDRHPRGVRILDECYDAEGYLPIHRAVQGGNLAAIKWFISIGVNTQLKIRSGLTAFELDPVSVLVRNTGIEEFSLMHAAAAKGHTDVVELLIKRNISFPDSSKSYPTALHLAAGNGHLEVVQLFNDHGATFDPIILHHAAARNHLAVVAFLLHTVGLRDTCIPCQPGLFSQLSLKTTMQETHAYFCETALHAAVSRGLHDMVQLLLSYGKESLECKHHSGKTVLMDAVERNDTEMVDLLLRHGANVTTECGRKISKDNNRQMCSIYSMDKQIFLYTLYCVNDSCECGNRAIHISAKYGLWKMAEKISSERIIDMIDLLNCDENSALRIAIAYDHARFVQNINNALNKVGQELVASAMVQLAVIYCSANVTKLFLKYPVNYKDENVWHLFFISVNWSPCDELKTKRVSSSCLKAFQDSNLSEAEKTKKESERRLSVIKLLIETQWESLVSYKKDDGVTLLHYAAFYGFEDAVKYLVELGADKLLKDRDNGYTPLMYALYESPVNDLHPSASYRCYTTNDGQFSSCNTTCYDETVRYLIQSQRASISKCDHESSLMLKQIIVRQMPLSLYALLKIGVDLNCRFNDFGSVMLLHLHAGGREVSEVLNMFEVDISLKCEVAFSISELHQMSFFATPDKFGNFFKPSLNKKRFPLQRLIDRHPRGARILDECYDAEGYLPIHRAVQGGNLAAIKWFISIGVNTQLKTRSGLTARGISILELMNNTYIIYLSNSETFVKINSRYRNECFEELLRTFFEMSYKNYTSDFSSVQFSKNPILHLACKTRLNVCQDVYNKALEVIPSLKKNTFLLLDEQDENGDTPLHAAAYSGLEDVVKYLVGLGADVNVKNKYGQTPLLTALWGYSSYFLDQRCYTTNDGIFTSCKTTPNDEIIRYLLWLQKSSVSKCDLLSAYLLHGVILKRMPLSLYALLKIGVDINCQENESIRRSPFLQHIVRGGQEVSEVLKIFEVDVSVKCGVSFSFSELHLISYVSSPDAFGNFFEPSLNRKRFPLQRLIDRHSRGVRILDECYDAEGYLPIHRAAQGGNLAAIKWFKSIGVNTQLKTRSGLTALDISMLYLGDLNYGQLSAPLKIYLDLYGFYRQVPVTTSKYRSQVFEELLQTFFSTTPEYMSEFPCGSTLEGLSPLHIAAVKGNSVLRYVHKKASEIFPNLPMNCVNKHRLDPVYLAHFYDSVRTEGLIDKYPKENRNVHSSDKINLFKEIGDWYISEDEIGNAQKTNQDNIDKEFGQDSVPAAQYPDREVDYIMVFNFLYPPHHETTEEKLLFESKDIRISDCPGYYDNLPKIEEALTLEIEPPDKSECSKIRVRHDYYWSLCMREVKEYHVRTHNCPNIKKKLQWWFTWNRRRNRQLSQFILERMGWSDVSQVSNIDNCWPFYFLHKKLLKEYDAYEYLNILNEALEITDIRFSSRLSPHFFDDL